MKGGGEGRKGVVGRPGITALLLYVVDVKDIGNMFHRGIGNLLHWTGSPGKRRMRTMEGVPESFRCFYARRAMLCYGRYWS